MFTQVTIDNFKKNYKGDKATVNFRFICIPSISFFLYHNTCIFWIFNLWWHLLFIHHWISCYLVIINSFKSTQERPGFSSYNLNQKFILQMKTVIINPLNLELVFVYTEHIHISLLIWDTCPTLPQIMQINLVFHKHLFISVS